MGKSIFTLALVLCFVIQSQAQIVYRPLPSEWEALVPGGNFMDRILPMPSGVTGDNLWGTKGVQDRYVSNGIEDDTISYWGGNMIKGKDGLYHFFLCGWREDNPDGHMGYKKYSTLYHATADNSIGPFKLQEEMGEGHNTEILELHDGSYMVYHIVGHDPEKDCKYLHSKSLNGPWELKNIEFDLRDRPVRIGGGMWFHNLSFTKREDGSVLLLSRCGSMWVSKTGTSPYHLITEKRIYPMISGKYEDPVIWKDNVQYHAIVNDWLGRTAFYMRSKDGIRWKAEEGRAYIPGVARHADGTVEDWYKFERIRMLQDEYGRAIQANFAVIDSLKHDDLANDTHSSKNISLPLKPAMLMTLENKSLIVAKTKEIRVRIKAEDSFKPIKEVDVTSLRLGASSEVNFGRGAVPLRSEADGEDLVVIFEGKNHCIGPDVFAPKVLGKDKKGEMLFGYMRLPWVSYISPILSARKPVMVNGTLSVTVENYGQVKSKSTILTISGYNKEGVLEEFASAPIPVVEPYGKAVVSLDSITDLSDKAGDDIVVKILVREGAPVELHTRLDKPMQANNR